MHDGFDGPEAGDIIGRNLIVAHLKHAFQNLHKPLPGHAPVSAERTELLHCLIEMVMHFGLCIAAPLWHIFEAQQELVTQLTKSRAVNRGGEAMSKAKAKHLNMLAPAEPSRFPNIFFGFGAMLIDEGLHDFDAADKQRQL